MNSKFLREFFVSREDAYALQRDDGSYIKVEEPLTDEILEKHLKGEITIGVYQLSKDSLIKWLCFDIDKGKDEAKKLFDYFKNHEKYKNSIAFEQTGGRGFHLWIFLKKPIPAIVGRKLGIKVLERAGINCELFPKQEKIDDNGYGNLVKLPLGIHRKYGKKSYFLYPFDLNEINPIEIPEEVILELSESEKEKGVFERIEAPKGECQALIKIQNGVDEGFRDEACFWLARWFRKFKARPEIAFVYLNEWNKLNRPPLNEKTIIEKIKSAYSKKYGVSWLSIKKNEVLKVLCVGCNIKCIFEEKNGKKRKKKENDLIRPYGGRI